jgi:putative alpha-1,2-mannosidase
MRSLLPSCKIIAASALTFCAFFGYSQQKANDVYVNPFIGTTKSNVLTSWGGVGGTYPGAVAPSGNIQISPETRTTGAKGYDYSDEVIYYFSCFKHYSGFPEGSSGQVFIMPVQDGKDFEPGLSKRPFSHQQEHAEPGYYSVTLTDDKTIAEATTSTRSGMMRFTFPENVRAQIFVGDAGDLKITGKQSLQGSKGNTVVNFSEDMQSHKQMKNGYLLTFAKTASAANVITLKISSSTVSFAAAQNNIDKEIRGLTFEELKNHTSAEWQTALSTVDIKDPSENSKKVFYTALYHSLLLPWVVSDVDGNYQGAAGKIYQTRGKQEYGGFSPWDTFRSLHPLLTLLYPEKQQDVILSMLDFYKQTGHLPTESMTGNHAVPILVDTYLKGITGYDRDLAYEAMKKSIMDTPFVKTDMEIYHQMGYVPFSRSESVTRTMEYAYDDWALSQYAKLVMKNKEDYTFSKERGFNYRNLFHAEDLFMLPRQETVFKVNPGMTGYKEGNKWIYTYFVPHNAKDLVNLLGGNEAFVSRLDSALTNKVILYDNETVLHLPYLFNVAGHPELTQKWIRNTLTERFSASPGGLPGNDDLGSISSAYLFNAMGFFPASPGRPLYALGAPLFQSVRLHLANHRDLTITAVNQSDENKYVKNLTVNNQPYSKLTIPHELLIEGGNINFSMSPLAKQAWPKNRNPIDLSETKTAVNIKLLSYTISKRKVNPNEEFEVQFTLKNTGSMGTQRMVIYVDGKPLFSKSCLVRPGATVKDSISCRLYNLGDMKIALNSTPAGLIKVFAPEKNVEKPFMISKLAVKPMVKLKDEQQLDYTIKNLTGKTQTFKPRVGIRTSSINAVLGSNLLTVDSLLYTDVISVMPGEEKIIHHTFLTHNTGLQIIKIDDKKATFKVYQNALQSLLMDLSSETRQVDQILDASGLQNNGTYFGVNTNLDVSSIVLNDTSYVEVQNSASLDNMGNNLSMMAWVYPVGKEKGLIDMLTKGDSHVLQTTDDKTLTFFAGGWGRGDCTVNLPANWHMNWHHIAGVCSGDLLYLYVDGKLAGSSKVDGIVNLSNTSKWQIGRNEEFPSERVFHGKIDKVKIYEQPLSEADITALFNEEKRNFKIQF